MLNPWKYEKRTSEEKLEKLLMFAHAIVRDRDEKDKVWGSLQELYDITRAIEYSYNEKSNSYHEALSLPRETVRREWLAIHILEFLHYTESGEYTSAYCKLLGISQSYGIPVP